MYACIGINTLSRPLEGKKENTHTDTYSHTRRCQREYWGAVEGVWSVLMGACMRAS